MATTISITINSQELVDAFLAWNEEINTLEGTSLTPHQRVKAVLVGIARNRIAQSYANQKRAEAAATVEPDIAAEEARLETLT